MKTKLEMSLATIAVAGLLALPAVAADDSYTGKVVDSAKSAGEATKDAATGAASTVKDSAKKAGHYVADTASEAKTRVAGGKDALFVTKAAVGGLAEVKSAELAKSKASSSDVKSFAERMIDDHSKANQELEQIAQKKGIEVPKELDNTHQANLDKLSKLSGDEFDKAYVAQQKADHQATMKLLDDEAKNGKDPDIKSFAAKIKPVVAEHHAKIHKIGMKEGGSAKSGG